MFFLSVDLNVAKHTVFVNVIHKLLILFPVVSPFGQLCTHL